MIRLLGAILALGLWPVAGGAQDLLRVAIWTVELSREGPGILLRDILEEDPQVLAAQRLIAEISPDLLLLNDFDTDADGHAARLFAKAAGYPHVFTRPGNEGRASGIDMDKDGRAGEPEDALSYGAFTGQGGMALLSRLPIQAEAVRDFSGLLWQDLPGARIPEGYFSTEDLARLPLSSHAHWDIPLLWNGRPLHLFAYAATSPVFDGEEDRNGRRNADETAFWLRYLDGALDFAPPEASFVLLGDSNLDPADGEGLRAQMAMLLADPRIQDPRPRSDHAAARATPGQNGDPGLDTADWDDPVPGNLRVDYVLPSADLQVVASGVAWAAEDGFRHGLVWVDLAAFP
ncbi:endonuclease/exonuclease/phosphatase family protein [Celeribacter indicus]|uniref:Endonuclease/exonuclease/phosphatase domain-containing protein n=1 Tax=Celeribacter indicus TaxID=1208324 RepID=A0A0B5DNL8_9RHOB|nr:endonuclease/exonuclease/phosphatase family protein [Celeribacter indicus]AJE44784.1 hypothetical protein P73_0069 [Celeribacter indicus]SDX46889.1 Endonuclease/Exonuclease/phosphatase family protein [Celeribacter indicus]